jgi:hypothetical protein
VITRVALSCVLLIGTGLMLETLGQMKRLDPGFDTRNGLLVSVSPALVGYDQRGESFYRRMSGRGSPDTRRAGATLAQYVPARIQRQRRGTLRRRTRGDQKGQGGDQPIERRRPGYLPDDGDPARRRS